MTPSFAPVASRPRGMVLANGVRLVGVVSFEVDNNSFYQADTFHVSLCLSAQPASSNWAFWASQVDIEVELLLGYPSNVDQFEKSDLTSMLVGDVDEIQIDPVRDEITLSGRDLTARFVDNKTTEKYPNLTASQIATKLALARGLTPVVTATTTKAGTYYDIDKIDVADDRPEWDLLTYLAQVSGFAVYVKGHELHFEPKPDPTGSPYILHWDAPTTANGSPGLNAVSLAMMRNLTIAKDIIVTVRSYNLKQKTGFTKTANRTRVKAGTKTAAKSYIAPQKYFFTVANKTAEETQQFANQKLAEISQHEMNFSAMIPGDPSVSPRNVVRLEGTGTPFDQIYYPASVLHEISLGGGYTTTLRGKNSSPDSTVAP